MVQCLWLRGVHCAHLPAHPEHAWSAADISRPCSAIDVAILLHCLPFSRGEIMSWQCIVETAACTACAGALLDPITVREW